MTHDSAPPPSPAELVAPGRAGNPIARIASWLAIIACLGYGIWEANRPKAPAPAPSLATDHQPLRDQTIIAGRVIVAMSEWLSDEWNDFLLKQVQKLREEGPKERMVYAIIAADLAGLDAASEELKQIDEADSDQKWAPRSDADRALVTILQRLYEPSRTTEGGTPQAADLSEDERVLLRQHLGWFGDFAPLVRGLIGQSAARNELIAKEQRGAIAMFAFITWLFVCGSIGLLALIVLLVMTIIGRLRHGFAADGERNGAGWIYAEAFAIWITIFTLAHVLRDVLPANLGGMAIVLSIAVQVVSVAAALGWATRRVGSWRRVRLDTGLHTGRGLLRECAAGVVTYCTAWPLLLIGLLLMVVMMQIQERLSPHAAPPSHPLQEMVKSATWFGLIQAMILAAIVAPILEEIAFRGLFYRHLREATGRIGVIGSAIIAALVSSFIFSAVHPQGWVTIPALGSLAVAFCIAREWRGSLIAGMVAHGINNFVLVVVNALVLRA